MTTSTSTQNPLGLGALLFFYTETPLHVGCGEGLGAIDLPIQRERMSELPVVPGSAVKGALREVFRGQKHSSDEQDKQDEQDLFGPPPPKPDAPEEPKFQGALVVTDARLLLLPVRTVYGGWAWVTAPMVLERFARDHVLAGHAPPKWMNLQLPEQPRSKSPVALRFCEKPVIAAPNGAVILEDTHYTTQAAPREAGEALVNDLKQALPKEPSYEPLRNRLKDQLIVLPDTEFKHWAKHATEVVTRVRIDDETGTVAKGALWTEESLPAESLLWSLTMVGDSRKRDKRTRQNLAKALADGLKPKIFLGGDRTIGRGLCALQLCGAKEN